MDTLKKYWKHVLLVAAGSVVALQAVAAGVHIYRDHKTLHQLIYLENLRQAAQAQSAVPAR